MADHTPAVVRSLHHAALGDEDARACKDVPESACAHLPRNFLIHVVALSGSKTGDHLASAKLVVVWLLAAVGAPGYMAGLTVPIRESLALIPQLFVAALIRRRAVRKWFWVGGAIGQGVCVAGMVAVGARMNGAAAGWAILGLLTAFALSRGVCSVAIKDVQGKTVSKRARGRASGYASSIAGAAALVIGATGLLTGVQGNAELILILYLLGGAAVLWIGSGLAYAFVVESPGATAGGANAATEALQQLSLLRSDPQFRWFVLTRTLFLSTAFAAPFLVLSAREQTVAEFSALGSLLVAVGLANFLGGPVWGRWADRSSRAVLIASGLLAGVVCFASGLLTMADAQDWWTYGGFFFALSLAHSGVRLGRSTYLIDMATAKTRAAYTAVSNSVIGLLLLAGGSLSLLEPVIGASGLVLVFGTGALIAALCAAGLPEIEDAQDNPTGPDKER